MRILIIRHGDPDYEIDGLTEKGQREAELLSERLVKEKIDFIYCSTLGRAKATVEPTLKKKKMSATYCEWLREFNYVRITVPYKTEDKVAWDFPPHFIAKHSELFNNEAWREVDFIKNSDYIKEYDNVCYEFDKVLEKHGYKHNGVVFDVDKANHDTIVFVCHHGLASLLIAHLLNASPFNISQSACMLPTSVTTFFTEEREEGKALMRMCGYGDISHLYAGNEPAAFAGRWCETFDDPERH